MKSPRFTTLLVTTAALGLATTAIGADMPKEAVMLTPASPVRAGRVNVFVRPSEPLKETPSLASDREGTHTPEGSSAAQAEEAAAAERTSAFATSTPEGFEAADKEGLTSESGGGLVGGSGCRIKAPSSMSCSSLMKPALSAYEESPCSLHCRRLSTLGD